MNFTEAEIALLETLVSEALLHALRQDEPSPAAIADGCAALGDALTALTPYLPSSVIERQLARPARLPGLYLSGTVLLIKILGVTELTSRLSIRGRSGTEAMSVLVNQLFATLFETISSNGGGIVQFAGDSLTAFFDASELGQHHTTHACVAALALQQRMVEFRDMPANIERSDLQLRIVVQSGSIFAAEVGDASHVELVVTGRSMNRVAVALESAAVGEVLLLDEARQSLTDAQTQPRVAGLHLLRGIQAQTPPMRNVSRWMPGVPSLETFQALLQRVSVLQPYVPFGLPQRFLRAQTSGEFRLVTILFANFYAFSNLLALLELPASIEHDPSIVGRVLDTYYTRTQSIVHQYGGTINTIDMATAGDRLMVLFGAPTAHEDDPARAIEAALELRSALPHINREVATLLRAWTNAHPQQRSLLQVIRGEISQRIGIASGPVFAGLLGTPDRHDYTVIGETVGLAAQLLATAGPGDVLLAAATYRGVRHLVDVGALPPLVHEGKRTPVPIYRAVQKHSSASGRSDARRHSAPLAGRAAELAQLLSIAERALHPGADAGRVVALVGEAGIGKSRLAKEALERIAASTPSAALIRATCQSYEQFTPYAPIAQLLRQVLEIVPASDPEVVAQRVQQQLAHRVPTWSRFAPLLGSLLHLPLAETVLTQALTSEQRRDRLHDLIVAILFAIPPSQSRVLLVDDLHWADASSLAIIDRVSIELAGHPLLLLLLYRPSPMQPEPWHGTEHGSVVRLDELARSESEALVRSLLDGAPPVELWPLIDHTQSTPFFLEETVHFLLERRMLRRNPEGRWVYARPIGELAIPTQIEQLLIGRIDRLPEETRMLLEVAAVIGPQFSARLLGTVVTQFDIAGGHLGELIDAGLIAGHENPVERLYQFRHALVHDVVYSTMLFARRREIHGQVAAAIEQVYTDQLDDWRGQLAQHYLRADQFDRAFPHFLAAAQQAQTRFANNEALTFYEQALATAPWREQSDRPRDIQQAAQLHAHIGDVQALIGNAVDARWSYEWTLRLLESTNADLSTVQQATLQRKVGRTYESQGNFESALSWFLRARETLAAESSGPIVIERARVLSDTGWIYFRTGALERAQQHLEQALTDLRSHAIPDEQASILNRLGGISWTRGDMQQAQHYVEQSLEASQQIGDLTGQAQALNNLGILTESQGRSADSIQYGLQAMEINERIGSRRDLAMNAINVGWAFYNLEEYLQAREYFTQALEYAAAVRDSYHQMLALLNLGRTLTALGQWDAAERAIEQSQFIVAQLHLPAQQLDGYVALATLALQRGDRDAALREFNQARLLATDVESEEYGRFQRLEAQLAFTEGRGEEAIQLLSATEALFIRLHNIPEAERTRKLYTHMRAPSSGS
jgi:predicted ATPase/class 3 adenylate cyclase